MSDPTPTPLDLDLFSERASNLRTWALESARHGDECWPWKCVCGVADVDRMAAQDVPALVAEVRRLRAVIKDTPHGPHCKPWREEHWPDDPQICVCGKRDALAGVTP